MDALEARIRELAEPLAARAEVDLVDVDVRGTGPRQLVRVMIDRKGGVTIEECRDLSGALSEALDAEDPIPQRYALEVTSPGVDHPLEGQRAFDRVEGRTVRIHWRRDGEPAEVRGTVEAAERDAVVVDVDGHAQRVPYDVIDKAVQTLPW
ncbi:MAG: ribosome maturation factor RimP [Actinomycetota bacterium]